MEIEPWFFAYIAAFILAIGIYLLYRKGHKAILREKKAAYDAALKNGNKAKALEAGRSYYAALRGGTLTIYDEQALTNDLSTIQ